MTETPPQAEPSTPPPGELPPADVAAAAERWESTSALLARLRPLHLRRTEELHGHAARYADIGEPAWCADCPVDASHPPLQIRTNPKSFKPHQYGHSRTPFLLIVTRCCDVWNVIRALGLNEELFEGERLDTEINIIGPGRRGSALWMVVQGGFGVWSLGRGATDVAIELPAEEAKRLHDLRVNPAEPFMDDDLIFGWPAGTTRRLYEEEQREEEQRNRSQKQQQRDALRHAPEPVRRIIERLWGGGHDPKPSGAGWAARCPAHNDHDPSLSVVAGSDGRALVKCHAGCNPGRIVSALGLRMSDLFATTAPTTSPTTTPPARAAAPSGSPTAGLTNWGQLAARYRDGLTSERLAELAALLGVSSESLSALGVGWAEAEELSAVIGKRVKSAGWTFGMTNAAGEVLGVNVRGLDGGKWTLTGGKLGLFIPTTLPTLPDPVLVVEGASDTAAALTRGMAAVGRAGARAGVDLLKALLRNRECVVVGENDADGTRWPGRDAAKSIARQLSEHWQRHVPWALPPSRFKDFRAWHCSGAPIELPRTPAARNTR